MIDIGSNSLRLVVYRGRARAFEILFNEKVMAGLGEGVAAHGRLAEDGMAAARAALARFAAVAAEMGVARPRAVATAAVRDAENGPAFIASVEGGTGLEIEIIDGETEARASAYGVLAAIPGADGVVGDLGGGSLELIRIGGGAPGKRVSLPVGSLRLAAAQAKGRPALHRLIDKALKSVDWLEEGRGRPLYAVGGSWRALAHLHMAVTHAPLPVIHNYTMGPEAPERLVRTLARIDEKNLRAVPNLSAARIPALPGAAALMDAVVERLGASGIILSAYGLREGLLYQALPEEVRQEDPLISAVRSEAARLARFPEAGEALVGWTDTLFAADPAPLLRLRAAVCLLSDVSWSANPDFRAERALDIALHGAWVGVTHAERALLAQGLWTAYGGDPQVAEAGRWRLLADPADLARASAWGAAARLGQRLAGGAAGALMRTRLTLASGSLRLETPPELRPLIGPSVTRRLKGLAAALGVSVAKAG